MRSSVLFQSCVTQYFNITHKIQREEVDVKNLQPTSTWSLPQRSNHGAPLADFFGYGKLLNVDVIRISVVIKELLIISLASWFAYPRIFWYNRQQHTYLCLFICTVHLFHIPNHGDCNCYPTTTDLSSILSIIEGTTSSTSPIPSIIRLSIYTSSFQVLPTYWYNFSITGICTET